MRQLARQDHCQQQMPQAQFTLLWSAAGFRWHSATFWPSSKVFKSEPLAFCRVLEEVLEEHPQDVCPPDCQEEHSFYYVRLLSGLTHPLII